MLDLNEDIVSRIRKAEVLLIGCSAGGFNIVFDLVLELPVNFPVPVVLIIHRSRKFKSSLEALLHKKSKVSVKIAEDKEKIQQGFVYFAPSDYHLLLEPNFVFSLDSSEPELFCRPSINITFKSVADIYNKNVIALLLSGANEDGADGISYIAQKGGLAIIQNPDVAEVRTMPEAALKGGKVDLILDNKQIFEFIKKISSIIQYS